jgi:hypothetical protein
MEKVMTCRSPSILRLGAGFKITNSAPEIGKFELSWSVQDGEGKKVHCTPSVTD